MFLFSIYVFFEWYGDHLDRHVLPHSFPTRRSSDLHCRRTDQSAFPPARLKCPAALARRPGRRFWIIMHAAAIRRSPATFRTSAVCTINNGQGPPLQGGRSAFRFARNIRQSPECLSTSLRLQQALPRISETRCC